MDSGQSVALVIGDAQSLQHKLQLCVVRNLFLVIMIMILSISKNGAQTRVDVMGFEPMAFCMQSRRDTTTPYAPIVVYGSLEVRLHETVAHQSDKLTS